MAEKSCSVITISDPIVNEVIRQFQDKYDGFEAVELNIFGTETSPLFRIKDVEKILRKTGIRQALRSDKKNKRENQIYRFGFDYIKAKAQVVGDIDRSTLFFTRDGLYRYLMTSRGEISNIFREFLLGVIDQLMSKGYATMSQSVENLEYRLKQKTKSWEEIKRLKDKAEKKNYELIKTVNELEIEIDGNKIWSNSLAKEISRLSIAVEEGYDDDHQISLENKLMKEKYMKKLYVFIVDPHKIDSKSAAIEKTKAKKKLAKLPKKKLGIEDYISTDRLHELLGESSSSDETTDDEFDMESSNHINYSCEQFKFCKPIKSEYYYYTVSFALLKTHEYVFDLYVTDFAQVKRFKEYMGKKFKTPLPNIFEVSFDEMEIALRKDFIKFEESEEGKHAKELRHKTRSRKGSVTASSEITDEVPKKKRVQPIKSGAPKITDDCSI